MIFVKLLFPRQVAKRLSAMGWRPRDMPTAPMFKDLCGALRANGYDADAAAELWDQCLRYDSKAIEQLKRDSGLYGILHLTQFSGEADDPKDADRPARKRKNTKPGKAR